MKKWLQYAFFALPCIVLSCHSSLPSEVQHVYTQLPEKIDFNFQVRPILADKCYACHGPDEQARKAEFRMDNEEGAFKKLTTTPGHAFVAGSLSQSEAWQRIISDDAEKIMPPPTSNLQLTAEEKATLAKWISQGATWKKHWSFIAPKLPELPRNFPDTWSANNAIDHFVLSKVRGQNLQPAPQATKERLIRRLSFDLRGLPPSLQEIDQFLADSSELAYEIIVDHFLNSSAYAERMAMEWMDVARFADSHGLHADGMRSQWPWRDWVIEAFLKNLPYDQFVTWQLAGDLLPEATLEQKLATGFQRNHIMNSESGIVSEEFRLKNVADRVNTTATAFLGLTMECASCHDHKFDPVSQREYYAMSAFYNNIYELGMIGNDKNFGPLLPVPDSAQAVAMTQISKKIGAIESEINLYGKEVDRIREFVDQVQSSEIHLPKPSGSYPLNMYQIDKNARGRGLKILDQNPKSTVSGAPEIVDGKINEAIRLDDDYEQIYIEGVGHYNSFEPFSAGAWISTEKIGTFQSLMGNIGGKNSGWRGWNFYLDTLNRPAIQIVHSLSHNFIQVVCNKPIEQKEWTHLFFTYDGSAKASGLKIFVNGQEMSRTILADRLYKSILPVQERTYVPDPGRKVKIGKGNNYLYTDTDDGIFMGAIDEIKIFNQHLTALEVSKLFCLDNDSEMQLSQFSRDQYLDHYLRRLDKESQDLFMRYNKLLEEKFKLFDDIKEVMVLEEMAVPRKTYILERGQYDQLGEEVSAATPESIFPFDKHLPQNRLGLAKWLFSPGHPLTARVAVNRYWQMIFGTGIVSTPHDFGSQGALPSHPELLDYLALKFIDSGWDLKALIKLMVMSATYQQSSVITKDQLTKDANNRYLSRGASYRMQAEMIRDNALAASGLLETTIGGESVKPYQPVGLWKEKNNFSGFLLEYRADTGSKLYRRTLYTFIRRTSPPPALLIFDATNRDVCTVKRERTSTPLQALVLMNDPQYIEASRVLALRMQKEAGVHFEDQLRFAFRLLCGRNPSDHEVSLMEEQYITALKKFEGDQEATKAFLSVGEWKQDPQDESKTAALAMVVNTMMNFDEAYMKR